MKASHDGLTLKQRLWSRTRFAASGCIEYTGTVNPKSGYGQINYAGRSRPAHRLAYEVTAGPIPSGLMILHSCDNRLCVRPDHLSAGTAADNTHDAMRKGRLKPIPPQRGSEHYKARLNEAQVLEIRAKYELGNGTDLAMEYGVHRQTVYSIVTHKTWRHV